MLNKTVSELCQDLGVTWTLKGGKVISPDEHDVEAFFDEAVKHLHTEEVGTRLTVGGLIIEKEENNNYGVYVYAGNFK